MENEQLKRIAALLELIADELYVARMDRELDLEDVAPNPVRDGLLESMEKQRDWLKS